MKFLKLTGIVVLSIFTTATYAQNAKKREEKRKASGNKF
jgi:hypothetical protein